MFLSFLRLRDFRNERLELPLERGISLFFGERGREDQPARGVLLPFDGQKVLSLCDLGHQILITSTGPVPDLRRKFRMFLVKDNAAKP